MARIPTDAREFVLARWPALRRTALLVGGGGERPRELLLATLVELVADWRRVEDEGRPVAQAQDRLNARLTALTPDQIQPLPAATSVTVGDRVGSAWWALRPGERAAYLLAGELNGSPDPGDLRAAEDRLAEAHASALVDQGRDPAPWDVSGDVRRLLDAMLREQPAWEDPIPLIERRLRQRRRRGLLVTAGVAIVALVAGGMVWAGTEESRQAGQATPTPSTRPLPTFDSTNGFASWPARGRLASDPRIVGAIAQLSGGADRILWADDTGGLLRIVTAPREFSSTRPPTITVRSGGINLPIEDLPSRDLWLWQEMALAILDPHDETTQQLIVLADPEAQEARLS